MKFSTATTWADNIFVLAGGADPGGNLRMVSPLALDIYDPPMASINSPRICYTS